VEDHYFDFRSALQALQRQWKLIAAAIVICFTVALIVLFASRPIYSASALLMVDAGQRNALSQPDQPVSSDIAGTRVDSDVELAGSPATLLKVVESLDLTGDEEFGVRLGWWNEILLSFHLAKPALPSGSEAVQQVLQRLAKSLSVEREPGTLLIRITAHSKRPEFAAELANAVAETYIDGQRSEKIAAVVSTKNLIQSRIDDASGAVVSAEQAIDTFISSNINQLSQETGRSDLIALRDQINSLASRQGDLNSRVSAASASLAIGNYAELSQTLQSQALEALEQQRQALEASIIQSTKKQDLTRLDTLRGQLAAIQSKMTTEAGAEISAVRKEIDSDQSKAAQLKSQLRDSLISSNLPAKTLTRIYELQQASQIARAQYQALLAREKDLEAQSYLQLSDIRIASPAIAPARPSSPNIGLILLAAALGGPCLGIGLAFLRENFIGGFTSAEQAEAVLGIPAVSTVPWARKPAAVNSGEGTLADLLYRAPASPFTESIRRVRATIDQTMRRAGPHLRKPPGTATIVLVTSTTPEEGKTTLAVSLARTFANSGRATLLLDCDLRHPSVASLWDIRPPAELKRYIDGDFALPGVEELCFQDPMSRVRVVAGAQFADSEADGLVFSEVVSQVLERASCQFDIIILDTAPVGVVVDTLYLTEAADFVVYAVKWASTPQSQAKSAIASIRSTLHEGARILPVLTQQRQALPAMGAYEYYYQRSANG
jgi:uncharacterized protein involved in exopolysaccharide biosynthesis/Mrp family chromosome partitioning ATPase